MRRIGVSQHKWKPKLPPVNPPHSPQREGTRRERRGTRDSLCKGLTGMGIPKVEAENAPKALKTPVLSLL